MNDAASEFTLCKVSLSSRELMLQFEEDLLDAPAREYK
jgi:hypothetical protein